MKVEFADNDLRVRADSEAAGSRAWGPAVSRKYVQRVRFIYAARGIQDLVAWRALRVHQLLGERRGTWSMVLHDRWRMLFSLPDDETVRIEGVSNHYGD
jgi:toxin HigB-1